ncbi:MAG: family 20 glycosylhydrolase [Promethearchaeota archaeon]
MIKLSMETPGEKELEIQQPDTLDRVTPVPRDMHPRPGVFELCSRSTIKLEGIPRTRVEGDVGFKSLKSEFLLEPEWSLDDFSKRITAWLNERLSDLQSGISITASQFSTKEDPDMKLDLDDILHENGRMEAYRLDISTNLLEISALTMHGAYYGLLTFLQLLDYVDGRIICPCVAITDYPTYYIRGLVDDISRGQRPTVENLKKFIRFLSKSKQNVLILYIEDVIHFKSYPEIGENRGKLMPGELKEIQSYARDWFVNIIPGIELLGHMDNILLHPKFREYAEFPGAQCFDVSNPKTKDFVRKMLDDIIPLFDSPVFAPICDESHDFGLGNSANLVKEKGYGVALAEWYLFLIEEIRARGKPVVIFAHDVIQKYPEALREVQKVDAMIYFWKYANKKKYPGISRLTDKYNLVVAGGPAVFDWSRHFPYYDYAEVNMIEMGRDAEERGSIGLVTTKWGDFSNENLRDNIYYGLQVNGQAAWTPQASNVQQIRTAFAWGFLGTRDERVMQCLDVLSKQNIPLPRFPNGMFNRFWLDPFVRKISKKELKYGERFIKESKEILQTLDKLEEDGIIKLNKDNLSFMAFAARMARHYGAKLLLSEAAYQSNSKLALIVGKLLAFSGENPVLSGFKWLKEDINEMRGIYQGLWKKIAVPEGLEHPTRRFEILEWHYLKAIEVLEGGGKTRAHQLQSEWIWRAGVRRHAMWGNRKWHYFVKEFEVDKPVKKATVQGIAANHLKIHLNGHYEGEVLSRFSLGLLPLVQSVQWFDVTSTINQGKNLLCIDGINWAAGIPCINILLHVEFEDGTEMDVLSDKSWKVLHEKPEGWPLHNLDGISTLKPVKSLGKPPGAWQGPITEPVWAKGWKSSISFGFGMRNFTETAIPSFIGNTTYKALFWLFPILAKALGTDISGFRK